MRPRMDTRWKTHRQVGRMVFWAEGKGSAKESKAGTRRVDHSQAKKVPVAADRERPDPGENSQYRQEWGLLF